MRCFAVLMLIALLSAVSHAGPISSDVYEREAKVFEVFQKNFAAETDPGKKFELVKDAWKETFYFRAKVLPIATAMPGEQLDAFLIAMTSDPNSYYRITAANLLGKHGSEKCLPTLVKLAKEDVPSKRVEPGCCIVGTESARFNAIFALVQFAKRFPALADQITVEIRNLPTATDPEFKNERLDDVRLCALYQLTRDEKLLAPFYERLKSKNAEERRDGANVFGMCDLKAAPSELLAAMKDSEEKVRSTVAIILGKIADPKAVPLLIAAAADAKEDRGVRCNAVWSLGYMKAADATDLLKKLLDDPDPAVPANAAVALYRITGKKEKQFPEGYNAD